MPRMPAHISRRRGRSVAVVLLLSSAVATLLMSQPAPRYDGAVLGLVHDTSADGANGDGRSASLDSSSSPGAPIFESRRSDPGATRPVVPVAQPTAGSVTKPAPGVTAFTTARIRTGGKAVFLGDSYTTGWNGAGLGARGWPAIVGRLESWSTVMLAVAGTGFMNTGWTGQTIGSRVSAAIRQKPDVVFIAGGHNDSRWSASTTGKAADVVIDRLRLALPDAVLVIVAPIWQTGSPPTRCLTLRDHLRHKAASVGAIFIDPLGERWFGGAARAYIGSDGIHPTDAGHRHIADRILADLAAAG